MIVPKVATEGIAVRGSDGLSFTVPTPVGVRMEQGAAAVDGTTVYHGLQGHPDVTVKPLESSVRISTVIWDDSQTTSFQYPLPEGVDAEVVPDGSVDLSRTVESEAEGVTAEFTAGIGHVDPAWAVDANGDSVPTEYVVADGTLTQNVDVSDATFPVVADPTWGFTGPLQIRARWNRSETATIAAGGWGSSTITGVGAGAGGAIAGPAGAAAFAAGCLATSGPAVYTAGVAQNS
ncbi:MAG: hypothetical protein K0Q52_2891, partial [Microbacterium sp.]|nr:hypothetical protein [Microbacterium sp.]